MADAVDVGAGTAGPDPSGATIVVAAADADAGEVEARILEAAEHQVIRVTAPEAVADAVAEGRAAVAVLDLGPTNLQILSALRTHPNDGVASVRVVAIVSGPASARLVRDQGADEVLSRPFHAHDLVEAVVAVLGPIDDQRTAVRS